MNGRKQYLTAQILETQIYFILTRKNIKRHKFGERLHSTSIHRTLSQSLLIIHKIFSKKKLYTIVEFLIFGQHMMLTNR